MASILLSGLEARATSKGREPHDEVSMAAAMQAAATFERSMGRA
jgi:hypothetical protein